MIVMVHKEKCIESLYVDKNEWLVPGEVYPAISIDKIYWQTRKSIDFRLCQEKGKKIKNFPCWLPNRNW